MLDLTMGQLNSQNLKVPITGLILVLQIWESKPVDRKSWAGNILTSGFTLDPSRLNEGI